MFSTHQQVTVTRISTVTTLPYDAAVEKFEHTLGHWNDADGVAFVKRKASFSEHGMKDIGDDLDRKIAGVVDAVK